LTLLSRTSSQSRQLASANCIASICMKRKLAVHTFLWISASCLTNEKKLSI
jgi:hypothetical protein